MSRATHNHKSVNEYTTPVPMLAGKVVFYVLPHTPNVDFAAYKMVKAMKASSIFEEIEKDQERLLEQWLDELAVLLKVTDAIEFLYADGEAIARPVAAFKEWWEQVIQTGATAVTVFEKRCELVSADMMSIWNAAYKKGQTLVALPYHKPGESLTPDERKAAEDPASPLAKTAAGGGTASADGQ